MLRFEMRTTEESGGIVDHLGNAHCLDCRPIEPTRSLPQGWTNDATDVCDRCSRLFAECSPLLIEGLAAIESVKCKIF